jgi:hypothetical protein
LISSPPDALFAKAVFSLFCPANIIKDTVQV